MDNYLFERLEVGAFRISFDKGGAEMTILRVMGAVVLLFVGAAGGLLVYAQTIEAPVAPVEKELDTSRFPR